MRKRTNVIRRNATGASDGAIATILRQYVHQICRITTYVILNATIPNVTMTITTVYNSMIVTLTVTRRY